MSIINNVNQSINNKVEKQIESIEELCKNKKPLVVIRCITYNHEQYLKDALEGFIMQKTNFPFVAIVHDDASTDKTAEIIKEYALKFPDIILPIYESENQYSKQDGSLRTVIDTACDVTGAKYIAICEGDDYWTDPLKLQKQVDFLEENSEYGMCYTKANVIKGGRIIEETGTKDVSFEGLLSYSNFPTLTRLFKTSIYERYLKEINLNKRSWMMGDYPFAFYCVLKSKVGFIDTTTAVYRILENSASHSSNRDYLIRFYESADDVRYFFVNNYIKRGEDIKRFHDIIKKNTINYKISIYLHENNLELARSLYLTDKAQLTMKNKIFYYAKRINPSITSIVYSFFKALRNHF